MLWTMASIGARYHHHNYGSGHSSGFGSMIASAVMHAAIYRVMWGLPLPVVILLGVIAGFFVWRSMKRQ